MNKKITQNIKAIILGIVIAIGAGYVSAWSGAPANPPSNNVAAPINVGGTMGGSDIQTKTGDLTVNGVLTSLHLLTSDLTINSGTLLKGKVLTAIDNTGKVAWAATSSLGLASTNGGTYGNYWFQIGNVLFVGGINYPGTLSNSYITFSKKFSVISSIQLTSLENRNSNQKVHDEDNVKVYNVSTSGFNGRTTNNNGYSWLAIGLAQ